VRARSHENSATALTITATDKLMKAESVIRAILALDRSVATGSALRARP